MKVKGQKLKVKSGENDQPEQIENLQQQLHEIKNQLARALADYDNLRRRVEAEKITWEKMAASKVVLKFLPVFDMLLEAQKHIKDPGLEIVIGEFRKSLFELGIEEVIAGQGDDFNPVVHEATEQVAGGKENTIAELVQTGWKIRGESYIIRPAKVKVYKMSN
jgi:molecular chaperone GrpE